MPLYPGAGVTRAPGGLTVGNSSTPATPTGGATLYAVSGSPYVVDSNGTVNSLVAGPTTSSVSAGCFAETAHSYTISGSQSPSSGVLYVQRVYLPAGTTVAKAGFVTGTTAATNPTHWWTALLDNTYKQQAHAADQTSTAIAASTWYSLSMATPYVTTYSGHYYLALMIATSTTQPTLACATTAPLTAMITGSGAFTPLPNGASTGSLTVPGTDNSTTYAAPSASSVPFYMFCQ